MLIYILIIIFLHHVTAKDACSTGLCACNLKKKKVDCGGLGLTYIPEIPKDTWQLTFDSNYLPNISTETFLNISDVTIRELKLRNSGIINIENNSFKDLKRLQILYLSGNTLTMESLYNLVSIVESRHSRIQKLQLKNIGLKEIPSDLFKNMGTSQLSHLDLANNQLEIFNFTTFKPIKWLHYLDLQQNRLKSVILDHSSMLNDLTLSSNNIHDLPMICKQATPYFPHLMNLKLRNNTISEYVPHYMNCLKKLFLLDLSSNRMTTIKTNSFSLLPSLNTLLMRSQKSTKTWFQMESHAFNNSNLQTLDLCGISFTIHHIHTMVFAGCSKIIYLDLTSNHLQDTSSPKLLNRINEVLSPLTSLEKLKMTNAHLYSMPSVLGNFKNLSQLDVNSNYIKSWPTGFWRNMTKLQRLRLSHNSIKAVTKEMFPSVFRKRLNSMELAHNPLTCNCDLVWFIEWVHREHDKFIFYPRGYGCLNITERICLQNKPALYYSITVVSCLLVFVILLSSIIYKHRWFLKYQIYIWHHQPKHLLQMAERHFIYDIYVSYCAEDSDWIFDRLVPNMEDGKNIKLCIHERDFLGGRMIIDNIVESIEGSRRVLLILSNNSAKSEWRQFELKLAQKHVLDLCEDPLVVVLLEDIDSENMSKSLHILLKTTTYITWNDDLDAVHLFWEKLKKSLQIE